VSRFAVYLVGVPAAGLAAFFAAAPHRLDLLAAAGAGAAFGVGVSLGGYALVERSARASIQKAVQVFLAAMTVKVIAFAAFLLAIAFTTSLNPAGLAVGLVGATLVGEALVIASLRRVERPPDPDRH
jgi:hypothetical protein